MELTLADAKLLLTQNFPDRVIKGSTEEGKLFLFLAVSPDPDEGNLDPFLSVNKSTGEVIDFAPQDFPQPVDILNRLQA